jgi:hypothetical protein
MHGVPWATILTLVANAGGRAPAVDPKWFSRSDY